MPKMTRQEFDAALARAQNVYVVVEIAPGHPIRLQVAQEDVDNLHEIMGAEGITKNILAYKDTEDFFPQPDDKFDLVIGDQG
jgi:hypothetical protein